MNALHLKTQINIGIGETPEMKLRLSQTIISGHNIIII